MKSEKAIGARDIPLFRCSTTRLKCTHAYPTQREREDISTSLNSRRHAEVTSGWKSRNASSLRTTMACKRDSIIARHSNETASLPSLFFILFSLLSLLLLSLYLYWYLVLRSDYLRDVTTVERKINCISASFDV